VWKLADPLNPNYRMQPKLINLVIAVKADEKLI